MNEQGVELARRLGSDLYANVRVVGFLRRPHARAPDAFRRVSAAGQDFGSARIRQEKSRRRDLSFAADGFAAAHPESARCAARYDRARSILFRTPSSPILFRDAWTRSAAFPWWPCAKRRSPASTASSSAAPISCLSILILILISPLLAAHRARRQADFARAGDFQAAALRSRRQRDHRLQIPLDDRDGRRRHDPAGAQRR